MKHARSLVAVAGLAVAALFLTAGGGKADISGEQARALVKDGAFLLDVRTPEEFAQGHVEGATNIPVQVLAERLSSLPAKKDQPTVVYCHSGRRSAKAVKLLEQAGYTKVHDLGAMSNWK